MKSNDFDWAKWGEEVGRNSENDVGVLNNILLAVFGFGLLSSAAVFLPEINWKTVWRKVKERFSI